MITNKMLESSLENLLREMKNRKVVKKILQSKDVMGKYLEAKEEIKNPLQDFEVKMTPFIKRHLVPFQTELPECVGRNNVVDFCMALMLTECIDDTDVILKIDELRMMLENVEEDQQEIARKFSDFLYKEDMVFSDFSKEELIKKILL